MFLGEKLSSTTNNNTEQIDYDRIINKVYNQNASQSDSEETPTVIATPSNPHQDDTNNQINLEEDIDNFFQNQDQLQEQEGEELFLNAAAKEELHHMGEELSLKATTEEEVHRMGRGYQMEQEQTISPTSLEEILEEAKDKHDVSRQMRLTMDQITQDKQFVTNLTKQVEANRVSILNISDKIEKQLVSVCLDKPATTRMLAQVLEAQAKMKQLATTIAEETSQFVVLKQESEKRL